MPRQFFATTAVAMVIAAGTASAADIEPLPVVDWTGLYAGVHAGYGWSNWDATNPFFESENGPNFNADGFVGGVHLGYDHQFESFLIGIEGDLDYTDFNDDTDIGGLNMKVKSDWQGALVARAGLPFDNMLIYGLGGAAVANGELKFDGDSDTNTHWGWTVGGGFEYLFDEAWSGRLEVRYTDFGKEKYDVDFGDPVKVDWNQTVVTLGISRRFSTN